jgi:beta-lactamase regulating signal transducer with metallopeptidase domain
MAGTLARPQSQSSLAAAPGPVQARAASGRPDAEAEAGMTSQPDSGRFAAQAASAHSSTGFAKGAGLHWTAWLMLLHFAGCAAMFLWIARQLSRLRQAVRGSRAVTEGPLPLILNTLAAALRMKRTPALRISDRVTAPVAFGVLHPTILLPATNLSQLSEQELKVILAHELAHFRRGDLWVNWAQILLQAIWWFNPLLWMLNPALRKVREDCCDDLLLARKLTSSDLYCDTLLRAAVEFGRPQPLAGALGFGERLHPLGRRLARIMDTGLPRAYRLSVVGFVVVLGMGSLLLPGLHSQTASRTQQATASNQPPAPVEQARSQPVVTNGPVMKVIVVEAETGAPIADAEVFAPNQTVFFGGPGAGPRWLTDAAGVATIRLGEPARERNNYGTWFTLSARRTGFAPRGRSWTAETNDVRTTMPGETTVRLSRGLTIGGVVREQGGAPLAGVRVRVFGSGYGYGRFREPQEYPEFWSGPKEPPAAVTDSAGRWQVQDFPADLENVAIEFHRQDGSTQVFVHSGAESNWISDKHGEPLDLARLRQGKADFVLKPGFEVRGVVTDPAGHPLPNVLVKEGHGVGNLVRVGEFRTDAAGRFALHNRPRCQLILTSEPPGFAITSTVVDVGPNLPEVRLQADPLSPLALRAVDGRNLPLAGVDLAVVGYQTEGQCLDFEAVTDAAGSFIWTNAPVAPMTLVAFAPGSHLRQQVQLQARQRAVTFKLRAGMDQEITVTGKARDAKTGLPVKLAAVAFQTGDREGFTFPGEVNGSGFRLALPATRFRSGISPDFQLRLQAEGYRTLVTPWRDFADGDWDAQLTMVPAGKPGGVLLLADGQPAEGAEISAAGGDVGSLAMNLPGRVNPSEKDIRTESDATGHFEFAESGFDGVVLVTHEQGFLQTTIKSLRDQPRLTLLPWGRVEGVLRAGTNLAPKATVCLTGGGFVGSFGSFCLYTGKTDADGRFAFDKVPPGEHYLWRSFSWRSGRAITECYQMPVRVSPGQTMEVSYGGAGRRIIGKVEGRADWSNDDHVLVLKQPLGPAAPQTEDFATWAAFVKARDADHTRDYSRQHAAQRVYQLQFDPDGSFKIDDVPAGTYELRIRVTEPLKPDQSGYIATPELGSLTREVVVLAMPGGRSDEPLDLGVLRLQWKHRPPGTAARPQ